MTEQKHISPEQTQELQLPDNFNTSLNRYKELRAMAKEKKDVYIYTKILDEIIDMSEGGSAYGVKEEIYPNWKKAHFAELLKKLWGVENPKKFIPALRSFVNGKHELGLVHFRRLAKGKKLDDWTMNDPLAMKEFNQLYKDWKTEDFTALIKILNSEICH